MRFSWTGLLLAPLLVPLVFSADVPEPVRSAAQSDRS